MNDLLGSKSRIRDKKKIFDKFKVRLHFAFPRHVHPPEMRIFPGEALNRYEAPPGACLNSKNFPHCLHFLPRIKSKGKLQIEAICMTKIREDVVTYMKEKTKPVRVGEGRKLDRPEPCF